MSHLHQNRKKNRSTSKARGQFAGHRRIGRHIDVCEFEEVFETDTEYECLRYWQMEKRIDAEIRCWICLMRSIPVKVDAIGKKGIVTELAPERPERYCNRLPPIFADWRTPYGDGRLFQS